MLAQKAMISASYFSLIHDRITEVSSPPEYAKTIFIEFQKRQRMKGEAGEIEKEKTQDGNDGSVHVRQPRPWRLGFGPRSQSVPAQYAPARRERGKTGS